MPLSFHPIQACPPEPAMHILPDPWKAGLHPCPRPWGDTTVLSGLRAETAPWWPCRDPPSLTIQASSTPLPPPQPVPPGDPPPV